LDSAQNYVEMDKIDRQISITDMHQIELQFAIKRHQKLPTSQKKEAHFYPKVRTKMKKIF
jgi:hypothetical protein